MTLAAACGYDEFQALSEAAEAPTLNVSVLPVPREVDLSAAGSLDWVHFGLRDMPLTNRKRGGGLIGPLDARRPAGQTAPTALRYDDDRTVYKWSDGEPEERVAGTRTGVYFGGLGTSIELQVPAAATLRVLTVHLSGWQARARLEVELGDTTVPRFVDDTTFQNIDGDFGGPVRISFRGPRPATRLHLRYVLIEPRNATSDIPNIAVTAAYLQ